MKYLYFFSTLVLFSLQFCSEANVLSSQKSGKAPDFLLRADQISHDKDLGIVIARGKVKVSDGVEIIEADTVSYNEKLNLVSASGHVKFYDNKGGLTNGNYLEITKDLKKGFVEKVYLITRDQERFAAERVEKEGDLFTFKKGVYSPCEICKTKACKPPIWQLRASKIEKDEVEKLISYHHVFLDFKGVPVFYAPYINHPDPSVVRKSGVLMPFVGTSTSLGMIIGAPYYFSENAYEEVIIRPIVMTKSTPMVSGSYNRLFKDGTASLSGSFTHTSNTTGSTTTELKNEKKIHGHFIGNTLFDLNSNWRTSAKVERTTSPTYFKKYYFAEGQDYRTKNYLNSDLNLEGFQGKNYLYVGGLDFQNLRSDVRNDTIPFVAPVMMGSYTSMPGKWGELWSMDFNQVFIDRDLGGQVERLSTTGTFSLPTHFSNGILQEWKVFLRGDYYDIRKYQPVGKSSKINQGIGRIIPGTSLNLKYPLINQFGTNKIVLEPVLGFVVLPDGLNSLKYPNEDSQNFELEAVHLMHPQRFPGLDRIDDGQRINYGVHVNFYSKSRNALQFFGGQSYSFSRENQFSPFSGVYKGLSDYVGRFVWILNDSYRLGWSFRLGRRKLSPQKNTIDFSGGGATFRLGMNYSQINRTLIDSKYVKREQLNTNISSQIHNNWTVFINHSREFGYQKGELQHGAGLLYQDDCFKARFDFFRTFYKDRDVVPSKTVMLTIGLKNLGEYSTGSLNLNSGTSVPSTPQLQS